MKIDLKKIIANDTYHIKNSLTNKNKLKNKTKNIS